MPESIDWSSPSQVYHLPITGVLNHPTIVNASFKRKIFLYDKGDYESYRNLLSVVDWDGIFDSFAFNISLLHLLQIFRNFSHY
jgi:hypothetical protein